MSALSDLQSGRPAAAQKTLQPLLEREPTFRLARLLYADSLSAQRGAPMSFQSSALDPSALHGLLDEAKQRSKYYEVSKNIQGKIPFALIKPDPDVPYIVFADMGLSRVFLFEQTHEGDLVLIDAGAPPQVTRVSRSLTDRVSRTGFSVTPARSDPPAPPINSTLHSAGSQFCAIRSTDGSKVSGIGWACGSRSSSRT